MKRLLLLGTATCFFFLGLSYGTRSTPAATWYVKADGSGDAPTIQAGVDSASAGDIVLLGPGVFSAAGNYNVDFKGKAITVASQYGPDLTEVRLPHDDSAGFIFQNGEGHSSKLTGVRITEGGSISEGSLFARAILCISSSPTITGNHITNMYNGYGIRCDNSNGIISNNTIDRNLNGNEGGGAAIYVTGGSPVITDNIVRDNGRSMFPISLWDGIFCDGGSPTIKGNVIVDNFSIAALVLFNCSAQVINNLVAQHSAWGIWAQGPGTSTIAHNTIVDNRINISCKNASVITANVIAYGDSGLACGGTGSPTVSCNLIFGNTEGDAICGIDGGGNIFQDPFFCGPPGSGIYTLHLDSPCLPENNACGQLVGALPPACGGAVYVQCPDDMFVPAYSTVPDLVLEGFTITNLHDSPLSLAYAVHSEGPATLVDNGDPASLGGMTPLLDPGETFTPPAAALEIPEIREYVQQSVTYEVDDPVIPTTIVCSTTITFEPPVPVLITEFSATALEAAVEIAWELVADEKVTGFNVYRGLEGTEPRLHVNSDRLILPSERSYVDETIQAGRMYLYTLGVVLADDTEIVSRVTRVTTRAYRLTLNQNHPNPFNPTTTISFTLPERANVDLSIYDVKGRPVRTLVIETVDGGSREYVWDGRDAGGNDVSSGVYFYRLTAGNQMLTKKMVFLK